MDQAKKRGRSGAAPGWFKEETKVKAEQFEAFTPPRSTLKGQTAQPKKLSAELERNARRHLAEQQAKNLDTLTAKSAPLLEMLRSGKSRSEDELAQTLAKQSDMEEYLWKPVLTPVERQAAQHKLQEFKAVNQPAYDRYDSLTQQEKEIIDRWQALEYKILAPAQNSNNAAPLDSGPVNRYDGFTDNTQPPFVPAEFSPAALPAQHTQDVPQQSAHMVAGLHKTGSGRQRTRTAPYTTEQAKNRAQPGYANVDWWAERAEQIDKAWPFFLERFLDQPVPLPLGEMPLQMLKRYMDEKQLKPAEQYVALQHPIAAAVLLGTNAQGKATTARELIYSGAYGQATQRDGAKPNAFLHTYWNALMAYYVGEDMAREFATAHEQYTPAQYADNILGDIANKDLDDYTIKEQMLMDMRNNSLGRSLVNRLPRGNSEAQTEILITEELISRYLHGSSELYQQVHAEYAGFSDVELLLLHYAAEAVEEGKAVWLVQDDELFGG